jgi:hypothetical protein
LQTLCQKSWEKQPLRPSSIKPWLPKGLPRLTRGNLGAFLFFFAFGFLVWRFDFPFFNYPVSATASALIALAFASVSVYLQGDR